MAQPTAAPTYLLQNISTNTTGTGIQFGAVRTFGVFIQGPVFGGATVAIQVSIDNINWVPATYNGGILSVTLQQQLLFTNAVSNQYLRAVLAGTSGTTQPISVYLV